jgi:RNA polymerase sigma factor (TIGR02999 family)
MPESEPIDLPRLLDRANGGDARAVDALYSAAYEELRRLAHARLGSGSRDAVLDTTSLVHESFLRLAGAARIELKDTVHFMRYASRAMRSVIVDFVRKRQTGRRGGDAEHVRLTTRMGEGMAAGEAEILAVHEALDDLAQLDARLAQVVEMRYFGGMTEIEIAHALGLTERTVRRDWTKARGLLSKALEA